MEREQFDVVVVGSGPGGYIAALRAAELGMKTACIEKSPTCGGTCLNVGCIPSKSLLHATESFADLQHTGREFGIECKELSFNWQVAQEKKRNTVEGLVQGIAALFKHANVQLLQGRGEFVTPNCVRVSDGESSSFKEIESKHFILATGSEPISLPFLPFDEKYVLSSTGALSLPSPPKKLLLIGAGIIGVELASVYSRLGTEVIAIEMLDVICPTFDQAISTKLLQILKKQNIAFHLGSKVVSGTIEQERVLLDVDIQGKKERLEADVVLVAVGRRPYSKGLGLEAIALQLSPQGFIPVDGNFRTSIPHIFAIGDLIEGPMLAHRASLEGRCVAEIIAGLHSEIDYMSVASVIYTSPEVASVGFSQSEAANCGLQVLCGTAYFKGNARARCVGATDGFVKVVAEKESCQIIGMHIIGHLASELISEGVIAITKKCTLQDIVATSHAHPTLSEAIHEACIEALSRAL